RADTNDGGGIIEAEIHLAKRPKLFRQTEPALIFGRRSIQNASPKACQQQGIALVHKQSP
ncbi:hypothetical protein, partial [Rhizobium leguminosarum]